MTDSTVHLVFKTHLDVGFTDFAANVVQTYFDRFIPQAIALARRTRESNTNRFRWTTGAWLIYEYLERAAPDARRGMEAAIEAGDIFWHALPFTTHTGFMDAALFRFGLSYSQTLDKRFGRKTIAAKMTDVPGHTRAMVPLLAEAGVRMLHIGVNPAASVPDVPPVFRWRDEGSGTEIVVVYDQTYGGVTRIDGLSDVLAVVLTGDNLGPPSGAAIEQTYATLRQQVPDAQVAASSMDAFARSLDSVLERLPVVTSEIGDTWIQGVGTDPTKVRHYRELLLLRETWLDRPLSESERDSIGDFSRHLLMIPEHTWGMDEKTHLPDHTHYTAPQLATLRQTGAARKFEASWQEQRDYLEAAMSALDSGLEREARHFLAYLNPREPALNEFTRVNDFSLANDRFELVFDERTGAVTRLLDKQTRLTWADEAHPLALFSYQTFGQADYDRYWSQYIRNADDPEIHHWALEDNTKPGMPVQQGATWLPRVTAAYRRDRELLFQLALPEESRTFGAPERLYLTYWFGKDHQAGQLGVSLSWFGKPACRLPEAFWLSFQPLTPEYTGWQFEKLGRLISPLDVVSRGARTLHAIDRKVVYQSGEHKLDLYSPEAALVAPGQKSLLNFHNQLPDMRGGVHFNLYNNVWGTNFPMWFEEPAVFRFNLAFV